jgi:hypothetical protein
MEFRVAFLNCHRLFEVGHHVVDSPADDPALKLKVDGLAAGLHRLFLPDVPDLIGLCEVGSEPVARAVVDSLRIGKYDLLWQRPPVPPDAASPATGLALAYNRDVFAVERQADGELTPGEDQRFHWLAAQVRLRQAGRDFRTFWTVVNHWPSDMKSGPTRGAWPRALASKMLAEFLLRDAANAAPAVLMMGDFNCEPFDAPMTGDLLSGERIVAVREHARVRNPRTRLPYFYNPMWRLLGEAQSLQRATAGTPAVRPPGTHTGGGAPGGASSEWRSLDQILVNRWLMEPSVAALAALVEDSIAVSPTDVGASDHCAIGAAFRYTVPGRP